VSQSPIPLGHWIARSIALQSLLLNPSLLGCYRIEKAVCLGSTHRLIVTARASTIASTTTAAACTSELLEPPIHDLEVPAGVFRVGILPQNTSKRLLRLDQTSAPGISRALAGAAIIRLTPETVSDSEVVRGRLIDTLISGRRRSLKGFDRPFPITREQQGRAEVIPIPGLSLALSPSTQFFKEVGSDLPDHPEGVSVKKQQKERGEQQTVDRTGSCWGQGSCSWKTLQQSVGRRSAGSEQPTRLDRDFPHSLLVQCRDDDASRSVTEPATAVTRTHLIGDPGANRPLPPAFRQGHRNPCPGRRTQADGMDVDSRPTRPLDNRIEPVLIHRILAITQEND